MNYIELHRNSLYVSDDNVAQFDSFGTAHIPKEIKTLKRNKYIIKIFIKYEQTIQ